MMLSELQKLLSQCPSDAHPAEYRRTALDDNALGKRSVPARERAFRYLRELYGLDLKQETFAALRYLWNLDLTAQPLIALLAAVERDPALRATAKPILASHPGDRLTADDLGVAVHAAYPASYSAATAAKIGRNALSSWAQAGHVVAQGRYTRVRGQALCRPSAVAFALFLGHRAGAAGQALFDTPYAHLLDVPPAMARDQAFEAAQRGWIDYREVGGIVEVSFKRLGGLAA